jgi:hypothetical protein
MGIWNWLLGGAAAPATCDTWASLAHTDINPATGLPMVGGCGGIDVNGNPYGLDLHRGSADGFSAFDVTFEIGSSIDTGWSD